MKTNIYLITLLITCILTSCKKESSFTDFKFLDKPSTLACENVNFKLYNEALYSFEEDITNYYGTERKNTSTAYSQFLRLSTYNRVPFKELVSEHTYSVFKALKEDTNLWDLNSSTSYLNYNSNLITCIAKNISDPNLKTTFNALLSTNSLTPKLFTAPILDNYRKAYSDKYLSSYIAFDLFYAKLIDIDFSEVDFNDIKKTSKINYNEYK